MKAPRQLKCRVCGEAVLPGDSFCNRCSAPLRAQGYEEDGHVRATWIAWTAVKRLIAALVVLAAFGGFGYVIYHSLQPSVAVEIDGTTSTGIVETNTSTTAAPARKYTLIQGADRYLTAIAVSKQGFPDSATAVVLAPGDRYQEALCAAPLAKAFGGPLLLVPPEGLNESLLAELQRLDPSEVFLVGIQLDSATRKALSALPNPPAVTSLNGGDQYETAALVARQLKKKLGSVEKVVLVPSGSFAGGLAVAPLAASQSWPILLTSENARPPQVIREAIVELGVSSALVVGSQAEVDLAQVERVTGADQYDMCALVAEYGLAHGLTIDHLAFATGEDFPDALAAGPFLALDNGVLLLTKGDEVPSPIAAFLEARVGDPLVLDFIALPDLARSMQGGSTTATAAGSAATTTTSEL